jgi:hypothetical protein
MAVKKIIKNNEKTNSTIEVVEKKENSEQGRQKILSKPSDSNNSSPVSSGLAKNLEVIQKSIEARLKIFVDLSNIELKKLVSIRKLMEAGVYVGLPSFL